MSLGLGPGGPALWLAALLAVLALIWAGQAFLRWRWRLPAAAARRLRLTETIALDPKRRLHLVACDGRALLIETGGPQDMFLGWLPDA